ncbi:MAG: ABC transporter permease [Acidimicrobiia bacterium]|nr:ABC transporter permease [Acidimicrobiia bacterium]
MLRFVLRRLMWIIPTLLLVTFLVFVAVRVSTDPVQAFLRLNPRATEAQVQAYRDINNLNGSIPTQYWNWLLDFVRFDWGVAIRGRRPVWPELKNALANTAVLGIVATAFGITIGLAIGISSALRQYTKFDSFTTATAFVGISIPPYVSALLLQLFFSVYLQRWLGRDQPLLPTSGVYPAGHQGFDLFLRAKHLVLPVIVVSIQIIAVYSRYMRATLLEVLNSDYLRTARAKGISERRVIIKHAFRNALIPIVTVAAVDVGGIIGGLIITERVFEYRGMGDFFLTAFENGDFPQIMPFMVLIVLAVVFFNLLADMVYAWLDPRIRLD